MTGLSAIIVVMRADRLVAVLLLLQRRGQVTAAEVAEELEVSERTARRDLEALGMAGLPIYSRQGRNGGWQLAGGGRTDLSGLTGAEARALFLVAGPASTVTPEVKTALRKLVRALPEPFRSDAEAAATAVVVDPAGWDRPARTVPIPEHLEAVQRAVIEGCQISLDYVARDRRARRASYIRSAWRPRARSGTWWRQPTPACVRFVSIAWSASPRLASPSCGRTASTSPQPGGSSPPRSKNAARRCGRPPSATPRGVERCRWAFGTRVRIGPPAGDGRIEMAIRGHSVDSLAGELAGFGAELEIVDPPEVRERLARIGAELAVRYGQLRDRVPPAH